jgi:hypothetical protein
MQTIRVYMYEFAAHMKTLIRYSLIILTLGLFSSCAEQFREIRGSQNQGNAFFGGGLTSSTATKRTDKAKGETITPHQTVINVEQTVTEPVAENTPDANPFESKIEKAETNQTSVIQGQKSNVLGKGKKGQFHFLQKPKLSNPVKILKKSLSQRASGSETNGFLMTFGILGIIGSILGILFSLLFGLLFGELIILIWVLVFLLTLISSIWLVVSPNFENAKVLKIAATVLSALGLVLGLISWLWIFI